LRLRAEAAEADIDEIVEALDDAGVPALDRDHRDPDAEDYTQPQRIEWLVVRCADSEKKLKAATSRIAQLEADKKALIDGKVCSRRGAFLEGDDWVANGKRGYATADEALAAYTRWSPTTIMPTHITNCTVCGEAVACCNDVHALSIGGQHGEGGCDNPPHIEFCSLAHAEELHRRLTESITSFKARMSEDPNFGR
jgi:hypothetical protein